MYKIDLGQFFIQYTGDVHRFIGIGFGFRFGGAPLGLQILADNKSFYN